MGVTDSVSRQEHLNPWSHETRKKRDHRPEGREGKADKQQGERGDETANGKSHTRARTTWATTKATTILALAILSASLLLVEVEGGRRLNDYLRAIDPDTKQPAAQSVPFTSWPASPPASLRAARAALRRLRERPSRYLPGAAPGQPLRRRGRTHLRRRRPPRHRVHWHRLCRHHRQPCGRRLWRRRRLHLRPQLLRNQQVGFLARHVGRSPKAL